MSKNLCVIDIGTNAVKCKMFADGEPYTPFNKFLSNQGNENLNKEEIVKFVSEFIAEAKEKNIDPSFIYIVATEAFRTSSNQEEIREEIKKLLGKRIHLISPTREAKLSAIGGLRPIRFEGKTPEQVLYVESGGGSTEVSLVDLRRKPIIKIISTISIPLGSKRYMVDGDDEKTKELIDQKIKEMMGRAQKRGIKLSPSLRMVVNSTTASKIIARKYGKEKHNAFEIAKNQDKMSLINFTRTCEDILQSKDSEKLKKDYWLNEEVLDGFKGHAYVLKQVLETLKKRANEPFISNLPITTTIGGVKDGLMNEILRSKEENPEEIERRMFNVGDEEKINPDRRKGKESSDTDWMESYENFYKNRRYKYQIECNKDEGKLKVSDGKNNITYTSSTRVDITTDKKNRSNRLYEDMVILAKKKNLDIKFDKDISLENKLRVYAACQKYNMKIKNFIYNPKMLEEVSPETKKIVLSSLQKGFNSKNKTENSR